MKHDNLKELTKSFVMRIIRLIELPPKDKIFYVIGGQFLRLGTSVAASDHAACQAKSPANFISKMGIAEEETDESIILDGTPY